MNRHWILVLLICASCACQSRRESAAKVPVRNSASSAKQITPQRPKFFFPAIQGVSLGSTEAQIIKTLGPPEHIERPVYKLDEDDMDFGELTFLHYPGLTFNLNKVKDATEFECNKLKSSDPRWLFTPGIRVGMTQEEFIAMLGPTDFPPHSEDLLQWRHGYSFPPGCDCAYFLHTRKGIVVEISASQDWS